MSTGPTLLFLHGIGTGDQDDAWEVALNTALLKLGYPDLDAVNVVAPKYPHALRGANAREPIPAITVKPPTREAARKNRREFEERTAAMEIRLGRQDPGIGWVGGDVAVGAVTRLPPFKQAHNYLNEPHIRAEVLNLILRSLPDTGDLLIVGHSLGSVIAADLIRRLPVAVRVIGLLTIGSPLGNGGFDVDKLRDAVREPPANLGWWVNVWNAPDPVAAHRGLSSVFDYLLDFRVQTRQAPIDKRAHSAVDYLSTAVVAEVIGFGLFGSRSREIDMIDRGLDIPLDGVEMAGLLALRYAHLVGANLEGDVAERFAGALRYVQAFSLEEIRARNVRENRPLPLEIARLRFDLTDTKAVAPEPRPIGHLDKEQAAALMTVLASENVIKPFEISIPREKWQAAMADLTAELGLTSRFGTDVFAATKEAQAALTGPRGLSWIKWGAIGAGAAAMVVAAGGLALAAGPGLAGAAVITSALASFGPGGMIGGLLTAGSLVTAGGGGIAFGLASPGTTADVVEAIIVQRLAVSLLRQKRHLEPDPEVWAILTRTEIEIRRQHERLDEFSDASAGSLKDLKRKIEIVERALAHLREKGLEPTVRSSDDER
ncbi:hypothetical protein C5C53_15330 [Rathayibacter sp. AY1E3]|uniref:hypothetical protein n=1 Tax=unclassified Rathayibacter TaxID=2609250 RepID=UPI000CE904DB|nr:MULTISPECIES: hypothetical protein [unclassified Rathayibacter]PPH34547.1 hypothetical protein C5C53_15330 [Rathayibacter sp. AY1E3]PPH79375.1 hypothetical protein C5C50_13105 [Rathayibacter sp. AY1D9]